mgnify:CR=1 FL=1
MSYSFDLDWSQGSNRTEAGQDFYSDLSVIFSIIVNLDRNLTIQKINSMLILIETLPNSKTKFIEPVL